MRHQLIQQVQKHGKGHESQFIKQHIIKFRLETAVKKHKLYDLNRNSTEIQNFRF